MAKTAPLEVHLTGNVYALRKALSESTALLAVVHGDEYEKNISRQISRNTDVLSVPPEPASCAAVCAPMTLDEAIEHAESCVNETPCGQAHAQLAAWLRELRALRKTPDNGAKMREALEWVDRYFAYDDSGSSTDAAVLAIEASTRTRDALSAPARNCDLYPSCNAAWKAYCALDMRERLPGFDHWLFEPTQGTEVSP